MEENLLDKFYEEMLKRFQKMSDAVQYYFVRLSHKFWDEDRPLKQNEKIIRFTQKFKNQSK